MVAFAVINVCYMNMVTQTTLAREAGILKRIRGTPLPAWAYMCGRLLSAGLVALLSAAAVLALGAGVYDFELSWSVVPVALLSTAAGISCFSALGLAVTAFVPSADAAFPLAWGTMLPLCFISDVFIPIDDAPAWLRNIASVFPVRPFADALEYAFNPVTGGGAVRWGDLLVIVIWGFAASVLALVAFRWEPQAVRLPRLSRQRTVGDRQTPFAVEDLRKMLEDRDRSGAQTNGASRKKSASSVASKLGSL